MKIRLLVLALLLSIAANIWLLHSHATNPSHGSTDATTGIASVAKVAPSPATTVTATERGSRAAPGTNAPRAMIWRKAKTPADWRALVDELRAAGFPEQCIRILVQVELYRATRASGGLAKLPFWQQFGNSKASRAENEKVDRETRAVEEAVFGKREFDLTMMDPIIRSTEFGTLPDEKIVLLNKIERDYGEIYWQQRRAGGEGSDALETFEGRTRIRLLEEEKERDIAAVLTPQEFEDFERRQSRAARKVIIGARDIEVSEEEYQALYELQRRTLAEIPRTAGPEEMLAHARDSAAAAEDVRAVLGDDRFHSYMANTDPLYGAAAKFAQANPSLTPATTHALYQLQLEAVTALARTCGTERGSDLASQPEGRAALAPFATKLDALLGPQLAAAYRKTPQGKIFPVDGKP